MNHMDNQSQTIWSTATLVCFALLFCVCVALLMRTGTFALILTMNALDLAIVSLATFRLTHLFTSDKIFDFVREYLYDGTHSQKRAHFFKRFAFELLECLWCVGIWSALFMLTAYYLALWSRWAVVLFAIAGAAALLQLAGKALFRTSENN